MPDVGCSEEGECSKFHGGEFGKKHIGNRNYMMWSTYMEMVKFLLDFIRVERDGN